MQQNPIDKDKTTETPHSLPYAHHSGSALIKPVDKGRVKGNAMAAMSEQTNMQMDQIRKQIELLAQQAHAIKKRVEISEKIYLSDMGFDPLIGHVYHLYAKGDESWVLSMVAPGEWGRSMPYKSYLGTVRLLADHTWEILEEGEDLQP